ncbi:Tetratricopeptide-like helical [Penicillium antarcticum]|uniref:Tetratricopeptide-like helical n=1 Tax=Penicillium antarcticum TaxID=416450 RepID=UPI0023847E79|nr:Tetratricopeptide-like helical [Penicillium antarcticum]KAJ5317825.1 Tetratricopeptide-like helical [Penicillium antarcticum]
MLEDHSLDCIPEIEVGDTQNKDDLHQYVSQKLQRTRLFRGNPEFLEETIKAISQKAEGLWEWANLVIKSVLRCRSKEQIRKVVKKMPQGISAMLCEELQRLSKDLSEGEELSSDDASEGGRPTARIQQLNVLLTFVATAQKPLTVRQLDIILELILKEELMSLEDDIRTLYSTLFYIRDNDDQHNFDENGGVVTLRHSSFYEFFRMSEESGLIHVDVDRAEVGFVYVCLYALSESQTPFLKLSTSGLWGYAEKFLPSHLTRADPEKAGKLRGDISTLLASLFSNGQDIRWFIHELHIRWFGSYSFYPTCEVSELGSHWLDAQDQDTANQRAEVVLHWLLPGPKQSFMDYARSSAMTSDACPFTILLSFMVACWSKGWLEPEEVKEDDGLPAIAPAILTVYDSMAKGMRGPDIVDMASKVSDVMWDHRMPAKVLIPAQSQKLQQTPMWHARVAQALLLRHCYVQALEHFQISVNENRKTPAFSTQSLSVIHRDMSRAYFEVAMHKEALEHLELSETLRSITGNKDDRHVHHPIEDLLNKAQMKHHAKLTDEAIENAEEAWNLLLGEKGMDRDIHLFPFFEIFMELNQAHRLRSVLDLAFSYFEETADSRSILLDFERFILNSFIFGTRIMYRVLHYALAEDDQDYLDLAARALKKVDTDLEGSAIVKYLFATVLFEKGKRDVGVQGWYEVASLSSVSSNKWEKSSHMRSIGNLVALCLNSAEIPHWERSPLILDQNSQLCDICLVLSTWLRGCGDIISARDALRWCVKECISLLSDDDPSNDINALVGLFKVFLVATDSDEDLDAVLYLIKQDTEPRMRVSRNMAGAKKRIDDDVQFDVFSKLQDVQLTDDGDQCQEASDEHIDDLFYAGIVCDPLTECSSCKREVGSLHHWYFCRHCAFSALCRGCYHQLDSGNPCRFSRICNAEHQFYYTGPLLRPSERVPKGMVPLNSSGGEQRSIWVEEWKDRLAEKWEIADFTFEGGLSAWCMRILPEPQRARWATFFQT